MTNFEFYKNELIDIIDEHICVGKNGKPCACNSVYCDDCKFSEESNCRKAAKEWLLAEHKEPIKMKQWEYDLIDVYVCFKQKAFNIFDAIRVMKDKGYYKGVNDTNMTCQEILDNCVIVPDDYDFGGN